jgi:hypothetical protein
MFFNLDKVLFLIDSKVKQTLKEAGLKKDYSSLQLLEENLRRNLLVTLELKSKLAEVLVAKDIELNKELLAQIKGQIPNTNIPPSPPQTKPRFKVN